MSGIKKARQKARQIAAINKKLEQVKRRIDPQIRNSTPTAAARTQIITREFEAEKIHIPAGIGLNSQTLTADVLLNPSHEFYMPRPHQEEAKNVKIISIPTHTSRR